MSRETPLPTRDELVGRYLDQLPYEPYKVQEEALLAWFASDQGVLVCTPTGTGKTLIAEAALFEALHTGKTAYYTTPLIALCEQKFREMQSVAVKWGFHPDDVGLVTGNRRENPDARVLVVVAEILLNRLLHNRGGGRGTGGGRQEISRFGDFGICGIAFESPHLPNSPSPSLFFVIPHPSPPIPHPPF